MQKRLFEIAYNFDFKVIDALVPYKNNIRHFFMPLFIEHGYDVRRNFLKNKYPQTIEDYEKHIKYIKDKGFNVAILFQELIIEEDIISYYINQGINTFIIKEDKTGEIIRRLLPSATIIASITQKLTPKEIQNLNTDIYNDVVLFFPYNRNMKEIKKLPKSFNYILLANAHCSALCPATFHWYAKSVEHPRDKCLLFHTSTINIQPEILSYFDEYIHTYKIEGRTMSTERLVNEVIKYINAPIFNLKNKEEEKEFWTYFSTITFACASKEFLGNNKLTPEDSVFITENTKQHFNSNLNKDFFNKETTEK